MDASLALVVGWRFWAHTAPLPTAGARMRVATLQASICIPPCVGDLATFTRQQQSVDCVRSDHLNHVRLGHACELWCSYEQLGLAEPVNALLYGWFGTDHSRFLDTRPSCW